MAYQRIYYRVITLYILNNINNSYDNKIDGKLTNFQLLLRAVALLVVFSFEWRPSLKWYGW